MIGLVEFVRNHERERLLVKWCNKWRTYDGNDMDMCWEPPWGSGGIKGLLNCIPNWEVINVIVKEKEEGVGLKQGYPREKEE